MAEILGLGLSHYPLLAKPDEQMADLLRMTLKDPGLPAHIKDPAQWPSAMQAEWGDDGGTKAAGRHREAMVAQFRRVREVLDDFRPDAVIVWGDDQYENFHEDVIPPFCVCAFDDMDIYPWRHAKGSSMFDEGKPNVWNEGRDVRYRVRGNRKLAKQLVSGLVEADFDVAYAYKPLHHESFAHAFTNTILYLDYDRRHGWDYPTIAFPINCYGKRVVSAKGFLSNLADELDFDPPSPSPARCMALGAATAKVLKSMPGRIALVASSSWSHAFMADNTWRVRPDTQSDRRLYDALVRGDYETWRQTPLTSFENAGQQEMLNWCPLLGAMQALGARLDWSEFIETYVFNSNKVFAVYRP